MRCVRRSLAVVLTAALLWAAQSAAENAQSVQAKFLEPGREYATSPLWVWNDNLTEGMIRNTLTELSRQGVNQVFVHPRPGLMTAYLSDEWFRLWEIALEEAERNDMNIWIYDENSYPSGFAGGLVPEAMPESRGVGLTIKSYKRLPKADPDLLAAYRIDGDAMENVTEAWRNGSALPVSDYMVVAREYAKESPWYAGKFYVDLLRPGVTEKFLELTLEPYRLRLGKHFGKRLPGSFADEPHLVPAGKYHWTEDLPALYQSRWGYTLLDHLPALEKPLGDWKRVRHNYYQILHETFVNRWAKPYFDYCAKNNLEFTGHYWEHEWPNTRTIPDNMGMAAWQHRPGIDTLFNQYDEGTHAQFGNVRAVLEVGSVANQCGYQRTLCEAYGGSGWDARFEDFKRIGDWLIVLGINTIDEHLSRISERGARKGDYPPSFSYQSTWWPQYHVVEKYLTRLCAAMSSGEQRNAILVLEPTTTLWMYQGDKDTCESIGGAFQRLVTDLAQAQVEFDLGSESILSERGSVEGKALRVGRRDYDLVVIPPKTENLNLKTVELLEAFLAAGGSVVGCEAKPERVDGQTSERGLALTTSRGWAAMDAADLLKDLAGRGADGFAVHRKEGDAGILYHHRRRLDDGDLVLLVNTSITNPSSGSISSRAKSAEEWNPELGSIAPYVFTPDGEAISISFTIPPSGSLLLFLSNTPGVSPMPATEDSKTLQALGEVQAQRSAPNMLKLDYVDLRVSGETKKNLYYNEAATLVFKAHGFEQDPWDHAVQFKDEFVKRTYPADSGFEVAYRFTLEGEIPKPLYFVLERSDLYTVKCNGAQVTAAEGSWWYDQSWGKIDISNAVQSGENVIMCTATPFTVYHEIQPAYVLGDFSLKSVEKGFTIVPPQPLSIGPWTEQGAPLYGDCVRYTAKYKIEKLGARYVVSLPQWYGSVAVVYANAHEMGSIFHPPSKCDVTGKMVPGENTIDVVVCGTLKNTIGPHHGNPPLGIGSPDMFREAPENGPPPGAKYSTVGYGLMAPFVLEESRPVMPK